MQYHDKPVQFYVILTVDCPKDFSINAFAPSRRIRRKLDITETDKDREYDYLGGEWTSHKHRKYCGILSFEDMQQLVWDCDIYPDSCETMGSLTEHGWMPAVSFDAQLYNAIVGAYVTPIVDGEILTEEDWPILRQMVLDYNW